MEWGRVGVSGSLPRQCLSPLSTSFVVYSYSASSWGAGLWIRRFGHTPASCPLGGRARKEPPPNINIVPYIPPTTAPSPSWAPRISSSGLDATHLHRLAFTLHFYHPVLSESTTKVLAAYPHAWGRFGGLLFRKSALKG